MAERDDRFVEAGTFEGYEVYDRDGEKIGKVEDLFVNERDEPEYLGVQMGLFGLSGTTLVPWELCRRDEAQERIEVEAEKDRVKNAPSFDEDEAISSDYEREVHAYYGLQDGEDFQDRGAYGSYYSDEEDSDLGDRDREVENEDELTVQRTEEELRAGTREREAGGVNVRKRVRTDREQVKVPKKREEVTVERVPVSEEEEGERAAGTEISEDEDEIRVPVMEEEVVVEKKPVVKEEIRVQKDVVEDEEVVEEDVRKEEIEVDDESERRD